MQELCPDVVEYDDGVQTNRMNLPKYWTEEQKRYFRRRLRRKLEGMVTPEEKGESSTDQKSTEDEQEKLKQKDIKETEEREAKSKRKAQAARKRNKKFRQNGLR